MTCIPHKDKYVNIDILLHKATTTVVATTAPMDLLQDVARDVGQRDGHVVVLAEVCTNTRDMAGEHTHTHTHTHKGDVACEIPSSMFLIVWLCLATTTFTSKRRPSELVNLTLLSAIFLLRKWRLGKNETPVACLS